jgi:2-polyprenyl-3-methyl-5-hydroxy-6-metoxy-1,4-benzoquinol methylase
MSTTDRTRTLAERLVGSARETLEMFAVYLGVELGLYRTLAAAGPLTARELAQRARIAERYAREWLEQQAVAGVLDVQGQDDAATRRFSLDPDHARVLVSPDDPMHVAPLAHMMAGIGGVLERIAEAYRTGAGVPYAAYGRAFRYGQGHINRPAFTHELKAWIDAMPDVAARLLAASTPRIADVGCGQGWASVAVARAYPHAAVVAIDLDPGSVADARAYATEAGVSQRVRAVEGDATKLLAEGPFDLVMLLEALHDFARPIDALRTLRAALADGGSVLVADERVAERFHAPGDETERMMYGWSVVHCLPSQLAEQPSAAIGTVIRADTVRDLALKAGFASVRVLPVENDFFRLYRLDAR